MSIDPSPPSDSTSTGRTSVPGPPLRWNEILALGLLVVLADLVLYRSDGFAGSAAWFLTAPFLLFFGHPVRSVRASSIAVWILLVLGGVKLLWVGSGVLVFYGWALLFAFAMTLAGSCPYVLETFVFASQTIRGGYEGLRFYGQTIEQPTGHAGRNSWLNTVLPVTAVVIFGTIFILANPDLVTLVSRRLEWFALTLRAWLSVFSLGEALFWMASLWVSVGLLRTQGPNSSANGTQEEYPKGPPSQTAPLLEAYRNTLLAVIGLFAIYLAFEFYTLWFREFPREFFYSGRVHKYAHEGAAWLTLALGLATVMLSLVFRGASLNDPRLPQLKRLAWIWSLENGLLAITVYNRLGIYIGFNGMTRMRVIGLLGITCVAVGFALVVWKIALHKRFVWLLRRQLWTVAAAGFLYAVIPIDPIIHSWNVRQILSGDPAPAVQISVHPIAPDGYLVLEPLLDSEDAILRDGVGALLAQTLDEARARRRADDRRGWTSWQLADVVLIDRLQAMRPRLEAYDDLAKRRASLERFHKYVYQWY